VTRINRTDTLFTELRDIKRRLRLLEAARMRPAGATLAADIAGPAPAAAGFAAVPTPVPSPVPSSVPSPVPSPVPLMPARPVDWPGTDSPDWERLAVTWVVLGERGARLTLHLAADAGTVGAARVIVDSEPVGEVLPVSPEPSQRTIELAAGEAATAEIVVEARRTRGDGLVRVAALLLPAS
jgi:hypothetical protein